MTELVESEPRPLTACAPNWQRKKLGKSINIVNGYPLESKFFGSSGVPMIRIRDLIPNRCETFYSGELDLSMPYAENGDLLVGMDGDFNISIWQGGRALINQRVCKIEVIDPLLDKDFLTYALPGYLKLINEFTSAVTVKHLSSKTISDIPLPFPDIELQKSIVSRIQELFSKLDSADVSIGKVVGINPKISLLSSALRQSILHAAFSGQLVKEPTA